MSEAVAEVEAPEDIREVSASTDELLVGSGEVELLEQDGKFYLSQGEVAVDITKILASMNNPLGKVVLNIRVSNHPGNFADGTGRDWLRKAVQEPGPKVEFIEEEKVIRVSVEAEE